MSNRPDDDEEYTRSFCILMCKDDQIAFRVFVISTNTEAYDDETKTAADWFVSWDVLEDLMPFLSEPAIDIDIQWTKCDLEQKVQELGLERRQIVIITNPSKLKEIPKDSAVLASGREREPCAISSLLDPTRVIMDASMSNIRETGNYFLSGCFSLKKIDLSGLRNLQKVGFSFLFRCSSLEAVDLSGLCNVQKVGHLFLGRCPSLKEVDLSPLCNVQKVGDGFLSGCSSLKKVDLSGLSNVQEVGRYFLDQTPLGTRVILPVSSHECFHRAVKSLPTSKTRSVGCKCDIQ